ncbi:glycosyltransferase family 4 protein [Ruegeria arenilitoris]|uniref:GDP-mannose-dependent alpha-(1-6)-phosphatidylinositol monomannoside mannosyltransferase n=1 Tax=Ruegeria arenilitoris TaxID=1173585 RepID=A0A238KP24_9RHOB|nr:glycosyltransferase family 4 protein [Ruegeria arenilitoris]SMX44397.1 GDP-mannose-dependent alpha-(1-6)-phosphatidylinositol monomannoside mannosyltransferase [Ruegeria arenilitoris]
MNDPVVLAPNLKRRLSGVTATIARLVPLQAQWIDIAATGPGLPEDIPHIPLGRLPFLSRKTLRVWHARRNTEMLLGLILRDLLRLRLKLLFTSASQRAHTGYTKWLIGKMDAVVATSRKTAGYLERDAQVIMHGINLQDFTPPADKAALRAQMGLPDGLLLGCYGRIRHQKGTDAFVDAMIDLCGQVPDVHGIVMGRATEKHSAFLTELKDKVVRAGLSDRILFKPEVTVDKIAQWYQVLDLFIAPQRWEGFGLTPLEAMACGVPVVATDVGAFSEIVTDPALGRVVPPGDIPALAAAAVEMLADRDSLARAGQAARAHVERNFDINGEAQALVALYQQLLKA